MVNTGKVWFSGAGDIHELTNATHDLTSGRCHLFICLLEPDLAGGLRTSSVGECSPVYVHESKPATSSFGPRDSLKQPCVTG